LGSLIRQLSLGLCCSMALTLGPGAFATNLTPLHEFAGGTDGAGPIAGVVFDKSGALYGTTSGGGYTSACPSPTSVCGFGTVYRVTSTSYDVLYRFSGGIDGSEPIGGLVFDKSGAAYGTTQVGGTCDQGVVFKLTPPANPGGPWTETVLYSFMGGNDGSYPESTLIFDSTGALYCTTYFGGGSGPACTPGNEIGYGTVFKLTPPAGNAGGSWTHTVLYTFSGGLDGGSPKAGFDL
jgi:uncharacterized repeat protein (TIGR03803 family)